MSLILWLIVIIGALVAGWLLGLFDNIEKPVW